MEVTVTFYKLLNGTIKKADLNDILTGEDSYTTRSHG